jgi:hypothetical protein
MSDQFLDDEEELTFSETLLIEVADHLAAIRRYVGFIALVLALPFLIAALGIVMSVVESLR